MKLRIERRHLKRTRACLQFGGGVSIWWSNKESLSKFKDDQKQRRSGKSYQFVEKRFENLNSERRLLDLLDMLQSSSSSIRNG